MKKIVTFLLLMSILLFSLNVFAQEDINILLIGTDDLGDIKLKGQDEGRADAIYLLHMGAQSDTVKLLSFERDYLIELSDELGFNKLATSTFFGGADLCLEKVNGLFDLDVQHYIQINVQSVADAVNVIDGLEIEVLPEDLAIINFQLSAAGFNSVTAGTVHMNGEQILAFISARDNNEGLIASNDSRNDRQQRVVKAGLQKLHSLSFDEIIMVIEETLSYVKTNISLSDLLSIAKQFIDSSFNSFAYDKSPLTVYDRLRVGVHQVVKVKNQQLENEKIKMFLEE